MITCQTSNCLLVRRSIKMKKPMAQMAPIQRTTLADEIVKRITGMIIDSGLKPGDKLPSERELMEQLSVGRSSLRESIRILIAMGVVDVSAGEGMFVGGGQTSMLTKPMSWALLMNEQSAREVVEARRFVEVELAGLAAQRATEEQIATIEQSMVALGASQDDAEEYTNLDLEFHLAVGHAAGNSVMYQILDTLRHIVRTWMHRVTIIYFQGKPHPSFNDHVTIYEAIKKRDPEAAREAMGAHLDAGGDRLLSILSKVSPE